MLLNFIIIGAQKSATTFVHHCLSEHPDVFMPPGEVSFFENPDYLESDIKSFEKLFEEGKDKKAIGIKRPSYLAKTECPKRIFDHIPNAKLIVVLRDPIDRMLSAYYHNIRYGFAPLINVNKGLPDIIRGKYKKRYPRTIEIIEFGFYYKHLSRYLKYFKRDQLLILLHEELTKDPLGCLQKTFKFLKIDETYVPKSLNSRPTAGVYSIPRLKFLTLMNPLVYDYSKDRMRLHAKKEKLKFFEKNTCRIIKRFDKIVMTKILKNKKPVINQTVLNMIASIYKEDTLKLEKLLGVSLSQWKVLQTKK